MGEEGGMFISGVPSIYKGGSRWALMVAAPVRLEPFVNVGLFISAAHKTALLSFLYVTVCSAALVLWVQERVFEL